LFYEMYKYEKCLYAYAFYLRNNYIRGIKGNSQKNFVS